MGIIDTTNLSWSTRKVSKSKEVLILHYYESKNVNYTKSDDFSDEKKKMEIPLVQGNLIFLLIAKVVDPKILCHDSLKMGLYYCALCLEIQSCRTEKSRFLFLTKIVASSWWWHRRDRKCPFLRCHHQYLTIKKIGLKQTSLSIFMNKNKFWGSLEWVTLEPSPGL
jgi:hypothetical protein